MDRASLKREAETAGVLAEMMGAAARAAAGQLGVEPTPGRLVLAALIVLTLEARRGEMTLGQVRLLESLVRSTKVEG